MCGRFVGALDVAAAAAAFGAELRARDAQLDWRPNYNAAPTHRLGAIVLEDRRYAEAVLWGWRAPWNGQLIVNARSETAPEKRIFAKAFTGRRCLVMAHGFYEWRTEARRKSAMFFDVPDQPYLGIGALWNDVLSEDGSLVRHVILLTCRPNDQVAPVHDRMPVLLDATGAEAWLDPQASVGQVLEQCRPYPSSRMRARRASPDVNAVRNNGPELISWAG